MKIQKKISVLLLLALLFSASHGIASFPVKKINDSKIKTEQSIISKINTDQSLHKEFKNPNKSNLKAKLQNAKAGGAEKSILILVLLWFFLGWPFAAHRWYGGKSVASNILFILTFAGLGIWAIIDLIRILTGSFAS